jgi:hypothetical protein
VKKVLCISAVWLVVGANGCDDSETERAWAQPTTDGRDAGPDSDAQDGGTADGQAGHGPAHAGAACGAGRVARAGNGAAGSSAGKSGSGNEVASGSGGAGASAGKNAAAGSGGSPLGAKADASGSGGGAGNAGRPAQNQPQSAAQGAPPSVPSNGPELVVFDSGASNIPAPLLLFAAGYASFNLDLLLHPVDVATDVVTHPGAWLEWRRGADRVEYRTSAGWHRVAYNNEYSALPRGTRLAGTYEHTFESAGAAAVTEERRRYRYEEDGTFALCTVTRKTVINGQWLLDSLERQGTYEIEGYTIRIVDSDGVASTWPFFYRPELTSMWTDGRPFAILPSAPDALCVTP